MLEEIALTDATALDGTPRPGERYDDVVVVTPWYPTEENPMWGTFVLDAVATLRRHHTDPITVIHVDGTPLPEENEVGDSGDSGDPGDSGGVDTAPASEALDAEGNAASTPPITQPGDAQDDLTSQVEPPDHRDQSERREAEPGTSTPPDTPDERDTWSWVEDRPEARVIRVRAPIHPMTPRHQVIDRHRSALIEHALDHIRQATYVNAHVGAPTAAAVAPLLARPTRFVITEHATYVRAVFKDLEAATDYRAAVARAQAVFAVGDEAAGVLRRLCPQQADIIGAMPNPVRFAELPLRESPMRSPDRWLYVGSLIERKGVDVLLESFALAVRRHPERPSHLTLVGDGPLREQLTDRAAELDLTDRVTFAGTVAPAEVGSYLTTHDVLVHLSAYETFGITLIEAAATGLPVVVTRCGGPEETMALPEDVGLCRFVPRDPDPAVVVDAVDELRRDLGQEELHETRETLRGFYGEEKVADLLRKHVLGGPAPEPFTEPGDLVIVVVFQGMLQWRRLVHGVQRAVDMGAQVIAVDLESMWAGAVPAGVTLLGVGQPDRHNPVRSVERAVVDRAPRALLRGAGRLADRLPAERSPQAKRLLARAGTFHGRVSRFSERQLYRRPWLVVRGLVMARRAEVQPELYDAERVDVIVHGGTRFTQLTYRLLKKHPEATYHSGAFTARHVGRWWGEAVARRAAADRGGVA